MTQPPRYVVVRRSSNSRARNYKPAVQHPIEFTCIRWWHADRSGEPLGWQWWFKVISKCGHWPCCSAMSFSHCEDQQHVDEKILLQGTSWDNADSIVQNAFDNRICGRGMYGAWVYFASAGFKSHQNIMKLYKQLFATESNFRNLKRLVVKLPQSCEDDFGIRSRNHKTEHLKDGPTDFGSRWHVVTTSKF